MSTSRRLLLAVSVPLLGGVLGGMVGARWFVPTDADVARRYPLPHHVSKHPGGLSLRLAMVHDVIHERYPAHDKAFYEDRRRTAERRLAELPPGSADAYPLLDDLGASLDKLGRPAEAAAVLRDKLARQEAAKVPDDARYTTLANLGTFLVHAHMRAAVAGDKEAVGRVREGLAFVRQSIQVNPAAHFGREEWQARIIEFLLETTADPGLLTRVDCVGNCLHEPMPTDGHPYYPTTQPGNREWEEEDWRTFGYAAREYERQLRGEVEWSDADRERVRKWVARVGDPLVPFDEPVLGILGMWREGGGANPHFGLALGEIMLRVGQRFIAWTAFERAARLADRYHPNAELQQFLRDHCRRRQDEIERTLPADEAAGLRPRFDAELAHGERYQREYQEYETARRAAGQPADAADFERDRPPIASPVGEEEWYLANNRFDIVVPRFQAVAAWAVFGFGLGAFGAAVGLRLAGRKATQRPASRAA